MNRSASSPLRILDVLVPALAALALAGCGGGASTTENPPTTSPPPASYVGPPPASQDVQAFKLNVWDNLMSANRCGQCHGTGGQVPSFVRSDDINLAYEAANGVVDLSNPSASEMVTKVGGAARRCRRRRSRTRARASHSRLRRRCSPPPSTRWSSSTARAAIPRAR
jgi:hypothetical protein